MCMEDVRIGRKTYTLSRQVEMTVDSQQLLVLQESLRVALRVTSSLANGTYYWCAAGYVPTIGAGAYNGNSLELMLNLWQHGDMVTQPWVVHNRGSAATIYITEVFLLVE